MREAGLRDQLTGHSTSQHRVTCLSDEGKLEMKEAGLSNQLMGHFTCQHRVTCLSDDGKLVMRGAGPSDQLVVHYLFISEGQPVDARRCLGFTEQVIQQFGWRLLFHLRGFHLCNRHKLHRSLQCKLWHIGWCRWVDDCHVKNQMLALSLSAVHTKAFTQSKGCCSMYRELKRYTHQQRPTNVVAKQGK